MKRDRICEDYSLIAEPKDSGLNRGNEKDLDLDENSCFTENWDHMINLFRLLRNFNIIEVNKKREIILSPLEDNFKMDLQIIVTECSFLTKLSVFATIWDDKIVLRLMK
ncbi:MAG: hypothetical protein ACFFDI_23510 [Promethearchaeota archaeon]